jgi:hypothetical protein
MELYSLANRNGEFTNDGIVVTATSLLYDQRPALVFNPGGGVRRSSSVRLELAPHLIG